MNKLQVILDTWIEQGAIYRGLDVYNYDYMGLDRFSLSDKDNEHVSIDESIYDILYNPQSNFFEVMFPGETRIHNSPTSNMMYPRQREKQYCVLSKDPIDYIREHCDLIDKK